MQLISRVNREFMVQLNIQSVFKNPTIENISEQILFVTNQSKLKNSKEHLKEIDI